jgi:hypothetical protein
MNEEALMFLAYAEFVWIPDESYFATGKKYHLRYFLRAELKNVIVALNSRFGSLVYSKMFKFLEFPNGGMHPLFLNKDFLPKIFGGISIEEVKKMEKGTEPKNYLMRKVDITTNEGAELAKWILKYSIEPHGDYVFNDVLGVWSKKAVNITIDANVK